MKIDAQDLPEISALLDQALDLPPPQRSPWLDALPAAQQRHRPALERMLREQPRLETADFMHTLPRLPDEALADAPPAGQDTVGPYQLIREIGRGGMGSVWLAERLDGLVKRQVALKLPHAGWATKAFAERLARERDILASLSHPNIARLYDAGVSPEGQPFIALAYVQGRSLIEHCDAQRLGVKARLKLFQQVLDAVQYAHAHLVIHRDLKPGNVLVDEHGQVQLLDFGIAKPVVDGQAEATALTLGGSWALTPGYASPEQLGGGAITTASDVYSLGVLLFELLTGQRPYRLKSTSQAELAEAILSAEVQRPSSVVRDAELAARRGLSVKALAQALRGDLDTIVLKALQKPVALRYATPEALKLDLQRHLDGEAVLARPASNWYRLRKLVSRHRVPAASLAAAAAALVLGTGLALWQASRAAAERDHALNLLSRNDAVTEFLDLFINEAAQSRQPLTVDELLTRSEALAASSFRHAPEHEALVLALLGRQRAQLDQGSQAQALLQRALAAARESTDPSFKAALNCEYASAIAQLGQVDEARLLLQANASRSDIDPGTAAECEGHRAFLESRAGDAQATVDHARRALGQLERTRFGSPALAAMLGGHLAWGLHLQGHNDEASRQYAEVLQRFEALGRGSSPLAIGLRSNWALVNADAGDARLSLQLIDQNLAAMAQRGVSTVPTYLLINRAGMLSVLGRFDESTAAYRVALAAAERNSNPAEVTACRMSMAAMALDAGRLGEARSLLGPLMATAGPPAGSPGASRLQYLRGRLAQEEGRSREAREAFTAAVGQAPPVSSTVIALTRRAEAGLQLGELDTALQDAEQALALAQRLQGGIAHSWRTGQAWLVKGRVLARQGQAAAAAAAYQAAVDNLSNSVDASHPALLLARAGPA